MDTDNFISYMNANLLSTDELQAAARTNEWIDGEGLPSNCPKVKSDRIENVDKAVDEWSAGNLTSQDLDWENWLYQERYRFLTNLGKDVTPVSYTHLTLPTILRV